MDPDNDIRKLNDERENFMAKSMKASYKDVIKYSTLNEDQIYDGKKRVNELYPLSDIRLTKLFPFLDKLNVCKNRGSKRGLKSILTNRNTITSEAMKE